MTRTSVRTAGMPASSSHSRLSLLKHPCGLCWLSDCGAFARARDVLRWQRVLDGERYEELARRALSTRASEDVAAAAQLLAQTIGHSRLDSVIEIVRHHDGRLREWFAAIAPENAWALGDL